MKRRDLLESGLGVLRDSVPSVDGLSRASGHQRSRRERRPLRSRLRPRRHPGRLPRVGGRGHHRLLRPVGGLPGRGVPGRDGDAFRLYTVAETTRPIRASGGMTIVPDYSFATAPAPKVIVIPAQGGRSEATLEWIRRSTSGADVTMSVCTGAFLLARTGLLSGKAATTHHDSYRGLAIAVPGRPPSGGGRGSSRTAIWPRPAACRPGSTSRSASSSATTAAKSPRSTAYPMEYQGPGLEEPGLERRLRPGARLDRRAPALSGVRDGRRSQDGAEVLQGQDLPLLLDRPQGPVRRRSGQVHERPAP